jgi:hypothetical protein
MPANDAKRNTTASYNVMAKQFLQVAVGSLEH